MSDAKKTATKEVAEVEATDVTVVESNSIQESLNSDNFAEMLAEKTENNFTDTSSYLKMEDGEIGRFAFMGIKSMWVDDEDSDVKGAKKEIPCAILVNENKETKTAAQMKLVNALAGEQRFVKIESLGKVALGKGRSYADFIVTTLS